MSNTHADEDRIDSNKIIASIRAEALRVASAFYSDTQPLAASDDKEIDGTYLPFRAAQSAHKIRSSKTHIRKKRTGSKKWNKATYTIKIKSPHRARLLGALTHTARDAQTISVDGRSLRKEDPTITAIVNGSMKVVVNKIERTLEAAIDGIAKDYRSQLLADLPTGSNPKLLEAMERVKLQAKLLRRIVPVGRSQACVLLGFSDKNPAATMGSKERSGQILAFTLNGKIVYPLFQFDVENQRLFPVMKDLISELDDKHGKFYLLYFLTNRNRVFSNEAPANFLRADPEKVLAEFRDEIERLATIE